MSRFVLQILDKQTGTVVQYDPGSPVETEMIHNIADAAVRRGVGVFRGSGHVRQDIVDAIGEVLLNLKSRIRPV